MNKIFVLFEKTTREVKDNINILLPFTIVLSFGLRLMPKFGFLYYPMPILLLLFVFAGYKEIISNKPMKILLVLFFAFGAWAIITAFWSDYPIFSLTRGGYVLLLSFGAAFGVLLWSGTKEFRNNPFGFLIPANIFILITSIISLSLGWPKDAWTGGNHVGFMGFFGLQLSLGGALLFTSPGIVYVLLKMISDSKLFSKNNLIKSFFVLSVIVLNICFVVLSHSRAALFSLSCGITLALFLFFNGRQKIYLTYALLLMVVLIFSNSFLLSNVEKYALKGTGHLTANREILWGPSLEAATVGGFFGIGYGTSVKSIETQFKNIESDGKIRREKGNCFLAIIEEVGLIGLLLFLIPIAFVLRTFITSRNLDKNNKFFRQSSSVLFSFLAAFLLHAQSEAWMVGMGNFSLPIFVMFITLFLTISNSNNELSIQSK